MPNQPSRVETRMTKCCLYCKKELPEGIHGSRKFCADQNPDGTFAKGDSICKTRHNNKKIKERDDDLMQFVKYHKRVESKLGSMYRRHKEFFTEDELREEGVLTTAPLVFVSVEGGSTGLIYRNYALKVVDKNKFKIIKYDHRQFKTLFS